MSHKNYSNGKKYIVFDKNKFLRYDKTTLKKRWSI